MMEALLITLSLRALISPLLGIERFNRRDAEDAERDFYPIFSLCSLRLCG